MNWKTFVDKQNAEAYVLPAGWTSREKIAEELECSPDRVREHLAPALAARKLEVRQFPVWDSNLGRKMPVTAYRKTVLSAEEDDPVAAQQQQPPTRSDGWSEADLAEARMMRRAGKGYIEIGAAVGRTAEAVRVRLKRQG